VNWLRAYEIAFIDLAILFFSEWWLEVRSINMRTNVVSRLFAAPNCLGGREYSAIGNVTLSV